MYRTFSGNCPRSPIFHNHKVEIKGDSHNCGRIRTHDFGIVRGDEKRVKLLQSTIIFEPGLFQNHTDDENPEKFYRIPETRRLRQLDEAAENEILSMAADPENLRRKQKSVQGLSSGQIFTDL